MISISTFAEVGDPAGLAAKHGIRLEYSGLVRSVLPAEEQVSAVRAKWEAGVFGSAHGPFFDLVPGTCDPELRALYLAKFTRAFAVCRGLGIGRIVLHSGWFPKTYPERAWIDASVRFWSELAESAGAGMRFFIENVYEESPYALKEIVEGIGRREVGLCLDVGHVNANSDWELPRWIEVLGDSIGHVHLHNNHGKNDDHNGLGEGTIRMGEVFAALGANCPRAAWNLEIRNGFEESIGLALEARSRLAPGPD